MTTLPPTSLSSISDILVTVEGHHAAAGDDVPLALADLEALLARYAGRSRCGVRY
jgi:hypothetical protein